MQIQVTDDFKECLLLNDIRGHHPKYDPDVFIARSFAKEENIESFQGELKERVNIIAFLIPKEQKNQVLEKFSHDELCDRGQSYFESDGRYITGETFEENGINFEIIANDRSFGGLDLAYYEPTDRMISYLKLHHEGNNWTNPFTEETIVKTGGKTRGWEPHDAYLSVQKSELIDYLAARRSGLLILKYSERTFKTPNELIGLPKPFNIKPTNNVRQELIINRDHLDRNNCMYFSRLWESFWMDPASHPRRWDSKHVQELGNIPFVSSNGEMTAYNQEDRDNYFKIISFKPTLINNFLSMPHSRAEFFSLSNLNLRYADGSYLQGCINREGQFQAFFGLIAKLDDAKQRTLVSFSEPEKAKPSDEYFQTTISAQFPEVRSFNWIISNCLREVNSIWEKKFGETLLLCPAEDVFPISILIGPTSSDFNDLADIMLEIQKLVIPESNIKNIKKDLDYSSSAQDRDSYGKMRSIAYTRLLFRVNMPDKNDGASYILNVINNLRNCKGHPNDVVEVLGKHSIPATSPRAAYLHIMAEWCCFLLAFKNLTEKVLEVTAETPRQTIKNPWLQLQIAQDYFKTPFR